MLLYRKNFTPRNSCEEYANIQVVVWICTHYSNQQTEGRLSENIVQKDVCMTLSAQYVVTQTIT